MTDPGQEATLFQIAENVYVLNSTFMESKRGLIVDPDGSTLIDTSVSFTETRLLADKASANGHPIQRIILTHSHFDHSAGCQLFTGIERIAQREAGAWMCSGHAQQYLARRPAEHPDLEKVQITLPTIEIAGSAEIRLKRRTLQLFQTPGHSPDSMSVLLEPDGILFTGDALVTCFPPIIQDGSSTDAVSSLRHILQLDFAWLVPGHGDVLRAEAARRYCQASLFYLDEIRQRIFEFTDAEMPFDLILKAVGAVGTVLGLPDDVLNIWHPRVVSKVWDEQRQQLAQGDSLRKDNEISQEGNK